MQSEKITNINQAPALIDRDALVEKLQQIPPDVLEVYLYGITTNVDDTLVLKNIISFAYDPKISKHMIDDLNDTLLQRLNLIVEGLAAEDTLSKIREIRLASLNEIDPTDENYRKAIDLLYRVSQFGIADFEFTSRCLKLLAEVVTLYELGQNNEFLNFLILRVAQMPTADIDGMILLLRNQPANPSEQVVKEEGDATLSK